MRRTLLVAGGCTVLALFVCSEPVAQDRQVWRYKDADGRIVYSDRAPMSGAKDITQKRVWGNTIETSEMPIALQQASERFPVTLYTFNCGTTCDNAQALLNRRGVPFSTVNVEEPANAEKLQQLTGEMSAPVLQVGDKLVQKGYNEVKWNAMLDQAGYPKTPARRTTANARPLTEPGEARNAVKSEPAPQAAMTQKR
ncbi:MAG TPA: glutaredoxin domain-containing protein [Casimicrobiaceae bacterium]|nr:glutaredoxin domain-containing protein [Casimicrobiaceae bacterium]